MRAVEKAFRYDSEGIPYSYDISRSKWLSSQMFFPACGTNGNVFTGAYFKMYNGMVMIQNSLGIVMPKNGTLIAVAHSATAVTNGNIVIYNNAGTLYTYAISAVSGRVTNVNADFSAGDIITVLNSTGGTVTSAQFTFVIAWRL